MQCCRNRYLSKTWVSFPHTTCNRTKEIGPSRPPYIWERPVYSFTQLPPMLYTEHVSGTPRGVYIYARRVLRCRYAAHIRLRECR